jgi:prephenate dehydrogenase
MPFIRRLVIVGVGLIGASFGLALRRAGAVDRIVGVGRTRANLETARQVGAIDEIQEDLHDAVRGAELVMLAPPVGQTPRVLAQLEPVLERGTVVTDAGSTKESVIIAARTFFARHLANFVPGHPVAGAESSGAGAASESLFEGRNVILTPLPENDAAALGLVTAAWEACGARVFRMEAAEHDHVLGMISHLPHALGFAFMELITRDPSRERLLQLAGSGFRDFTRIAGGSPEMWRDICLANREPLLVALDAFGDTLDEMRAALETQDGAALAGLFTRASAARRQWGARGGDDRDGPGQ